jgi:hypothetical protein
MISGFVLTAVSVSKLTSILRQNITNRRQTRIMQTAHTILVSASSTEGASAKISKWLLIITNRLQITAIPRLSRIIGDVFGCSVDGWFPIDNRLYRRKSHLLRTADRAD